AQPLASQLLRGTGVVAHQLLRLCRHPPVDRRGGELFKLVEDEAAGVDPLARLVEAPGHREQFGEGARDLRLERAVAAVGLEQLLAAVDSGRDGHGAFAEGKDEGRDYPAARGLMA